MVAACGGGSDGGTTTGGEAVGSDGGSTSSSSGGSGSSTGGSSTGGSSTGGSSSGGDSSGSSGGTTGGQTTNSAFVTPLSTNRFLTQATFGPRPEDADRLTGTSASNWILEEFDKIPTFYTPVYERWRDLMQDGPPWFVWNTPEYGFWIHATNADDQLRQRLTYALSQILVVSTSTISVERAPAAFTYYQDLLVQNAFGNYRDLLEDITYSPVMAQWLTYMGSQKEDPETGQMPDENYARELLQLFTIGVEELNMDGTPRLDANGDPMETYTNEDITGLAKVFTGMAVAGDRYPWQGGSLKSAEEEQVTQPLAFFPEHHSTSEKTFLGLTIPANTSGEESITLALDHIFAHPNVAPFIGRQLIQRFTTSNPSPAYVERVATAFQNGEFTLPSGAVVGDGRKGDLKATIAAVLFDPAARDESALTNNSFGKVREPVIRVVNFLRAFNAQNIEPMYDTRRFQFTGDPDDLAQQPFGAPSVFNFYRPGYVAPSTETGALGMTVPELQIVNATSTPGYVNFMDDLVYRDGNPPEWYVTNHVQRMADTFGVIISEDDVRNSFMPNYDDLLVLVDDPAALVDVLNDRLTYGMLSDETRNVILDAVNSIPLEGDEADEDSPLRRVQMAVLLVISSPDFIVQR